MILYQEKCSSQGYLFDAKTKKVLECTLRER